jgi:hypothetical protein
MDNSFISFRIKNENINDSESLTESTTKESDKKD